MRAEDIAPRTWLLGAAAGWALLAWLLALFGLGGRVAPLAEDPSLLQPLPQSRPSPAERLGPFGQYGETAARPLFSEDRRPKPFSLRPEGEAETSNFEYVLTGILLTPSLKMAVLQPTGGGDSIRVKLGESSEQAAAWRLVTLEPRKAVFEGPEGQRSMDLRAYDGTGGEPPTPSGQQPVAGARRPPPPAIQIDVPTGAADAAANAANAVADATAAPKPARPAAPRPPQPATDQTATTPEAQIEAIRQRIQARREQLRREAQQAPPANNP